MSCLDTALFALRGSLLRRLGSLPTCTPQGSVFHLLHPVNVLSRSSSYVRPCFYCYLGCFCHLAMGSTANGSIIVNIINDANDVHHNSMRSSDRSCRPRFVDGSYSESLMV